MAEVCVLHSFVKPMLPIATSYDQEFETVSPFDA